MNIWGWLVVLGAVGASVGFVLYGMGTSTLLPDDQLISSGRYLMVGGLIAATFVIVANTLVDLVQAMLDPKLRAA